MKGARQLSEENARKQIVPYIENITPKNIHDDEDETYHEIDEMFEDVPINYQIIEKTWISLTPAEKDSEIFSFEHTGSGGGVIKLDEVV